MRLPNFLLIGAQKCGTTWLHHQLRQHPQIFMPPTKEQSYFCWDSGPLAYSQQQYQTYFAESSLPACGEATAAYFWTHTGSEWDIKPLGYHPDIPRRVYQTLGADTRLILTLRNPLQRAVSAYFHHLAWGAIAPDQPLLAAGHFMGLIDMGFYAAHLANWLAVFPLENFLILTLEADIEPQPQATLERCYRHLAVTAPEVALAGVELPQYPGTARIWREGAVWVRKPQYATLNLPEPTAAELHTYYQCRVDSTTLVRLQQIYAADTLRLSQLLGIDFQALWPTVG